MVGLVGGGAIEEETTETDGGEGEEDGGEVCGHSGYVGNW